MGSRLSTRPLQLTQPLTQVLHRSLFFEKCGEVLDRGGCQEETQKGLEKPKQLSCQKVQRGG